MSKLENELKKALRREMPPEGFTERVLVRAAAEQGRRPRWERFYGFFHLSRMRWAISLAAVLVVLFAGLRYERQRRIAIEGEQAKQQVLLALKITAEQLRGVEKSIQQLNVSR